MEAQVGLAERLRLQAVACASMGSPFYGSFLENAAHAYDCGGVLRPLLDRHVHRTRPGLLLAGAAHYRALLDLAPAIAAHFPSTGGDGDPQAAWRATQADLLSHEREYDEQLSLTVQTNEVARATPILAAMLTVAHETQLPLRIFEIGSSAGLLLNFDRYHHTGEGWSWGDPDSELTLSNRTREGVPKHLETRLEIAQRQGCDVHPLDARKSGDAARLLSFVWPDQSERFDRVRRAISIAQAHPVTVDRADGAAWIAQQAAVKDGFVRVVMHTVMVEHLTAEQRRDLENVIRRVGESAGARSPFAWVRMEPPALTLSYETAITLWPGAREFVVARSDGHAQNLRWDPQAA